MLHIGCHLSSSRGFLAMGRSALALGADTFQFFTRSPRSSRAKVLDLSDVRALAQLLREHAFAPVLAHAPYTLNLCTPQEENRRFAREMMADDLRRLSHLPGQFYNLHPGSHAGQGRAAGIRLIAQGLQAVLAQAADTVVLLETMAGTGSQIGGRFEDLREIMDRTGAPEGRLGVCLDTCHVFDAGYDLRQDLDGVLEEFDRIIGLGRLRAVHLNDSLNGCGSRKDRHARIGAGRIGREALIRLVRHPALRDLPFCLETPNDLPGYGREIGWLREACA